MKKNSNKTSEEVEFMCENIKYKEKVFKNNGGVLFQGLKVE